MKKLLIVLLVLVLGCAGAWADGEKVTATGRGQGINGDVVVKVEADAEKIYSEVISILFREEKHEENE